MSRLTIHLFDGLNTFFDGAPHNAAFETNTARLLLAYLAYYSGHSFSREYLGNLLWPESVSKAARTSLRQTLARLSRALATPQGEFPALQVSTHEVCLVPHSDLYIDSIHFEVLLAGVRAHAHRRPEACPVCADNLKKAATLYRGDLLINLTSKSANFEQWLSTERERLHQEMGWVLSSLSHHAMLRGEQQHAQMYLRRLLGGEPWNEEAHRMLMRSLALSGQRSAALDQYRICRDALRKDFDTSPSPETEALLKLIQRGNLLASRLTNLPIPLTSLFGRQEEIARVVAWLSDPACRLVTIYGLGGIGKTRLALAVAREMLGSFRDGVWYLKTDDYPVQRTLESDLNPLASMLVNTLKIPINNEVDLYKQALDYLASREMMIVLDGFEVLQERWCNSLIEILQQSPEVTLLVASRHRLDFQAEQAFRVMGLPVSSGSNDDSPAIQLFIERARRINYEFSPDPASVHAILEICRALEGLPLGIELAAARLDQISPVQLATDISSTLKELSTTAADIPDRHRSLQALFDHSWVLLSLQERLTLASVSVFEGGFNAAAVKAVAGVSMDTMERLCGKSLVRMTPDRRMSLHPMVREYAQEKLSTGQDLGPDGERLFPSVKERYCRHYLETMVNLAGAFLDGQPDAMVWIENEWKNIERAWLCAVQECNIDLLEAALLPLVQNTLRRGFIELGEYLLQVALEGIDVTSGSRQRNLHLRMQAERLSFLNARNDYAKVCDEADRILSLKTDYIQAEYQANLQWGIALGSIGEPRTSLKKLESALRLARRARNLQDECTVYIAMGQVSQNRGDHQNARRHLELGLQLSRQLNNRSAIALTLNQLSKVAFMEGNTAGTEQYAEEALTLARGINNRGLEVDALVNLGVAAVLKKDYLSADKHLNRAMTICEEIGNRAQQAYCLNSLGYVAHLDGRTQEAIYYLDQSLALGRRLGVWHIIAGALTTLGIVYISQGITADAELHLREGMEASLSSGATRTSVFGLVGFALLSEQSGEYSRAVELLGVALAHPALEVDVRKLTAEPLLARLETNITSKEFNASLALGRNADFETVVKEILAPAT